MKKNSDNSNNTNSLRAEASILDPSSENVRVPCNSLSTTTELGNGHIGVREIVTMCLKYSGVAKYWDPVLNLPSIKRVICMETHC